MPSGLVIVIVIAIVIVIVIVTAAREGHTKAAEAIAISLKGK
jgi:hypothetical protein